MRPPGQVMRAAAPLRVRQQPVQRAAVAVRRANPMAPRGAPEPKRRPGFAGGPKPGAGGRPSLKQVMSQRGPGAAATGGPPRFDPSGPVAPVGALRAVTPAGRPVASMPVAAAAQPDAASLMRQREEEWSQEQGQLQHLNLGDAVPLDAPAAGPPDPAEALQGLGDAVPLDDWHGAPNTDPAVVLNLGDAVPLDDDEPPPPPPDEEYPGEDPGYFGGQSQWQPQPQSHTPASGGSLVGSQGGSFVGTPSAGGSFPAAPASGGGSFVAPAPNRAAAPAMSVPSAGPEETYMARPRGPEPDEQGAWFFPNLGRRDAEAQLRSCPKPAYLVRASSIANAYALSKYEPKQKILEHLLIQQVAGGKWHLDDTEDHNLYKTLEHLVSYTPYLKGYDPVGDFVQIAASSSSPQPNSSSEPVQSPRAVTGGGSYPVDQQGNAGGGGSFLASSSYAAEAPDDSWMQPLILTQTPGYLVETVDVNSPAVEEGKPKLISADANTAYYDHYFFGKAHMLYVGKVPANAEGELAGLELVIVAVEAFSSSKTHEMPTQLRVLVKTKLDEHWCFVDFQSVVKGGGSKKAIAKCVKEAMAKSEHDPILSGLGKLDKFNLVLAADESNSGGGPLSTGDVDAGPFAKALVNMERMVMQAGYKFGVLFTRTGQSTEDEYFSNREDECSVYFGSFLDLLGERIQLLGWEKYRGGLNVRDDSTGTHSVFTEHEGCPVMFHVAPLLPYQDNDPQRVEKKRHLGNDVVMIVFREPDEVAPFDPAQITSEFNHVFLVVQPVVHPGVIPSDPSEVWYRVSVCTRDATTPVAPLIPPPAVFRHSEHLQYWILSKLINGERNAMNNMSRFKRKVQETKKMQMKLLVEEHAAGALKK
jgi:Rap/ran-GAP/SH2 domain